ncbi:MAG: leucine-rich repeat protein [Prevotella sp.]|nr:leucine-rich repeat protein [Prevotella sp.]
MKIKLLVLLLLSCLTTGVGAKTVINVDILYYLNDNDKTATVVGLDFNYQENLEIPLGFSYSENSYSHSTSKYYTVTGIGSSAFKNKIWLETVAIPKTVTDIGEDVFFGCI